METIIILKIITASCICAMCYQILISKGELLQSWARLINLSDMPEILKKLLLCGHCVAGQISFWAAFHFFVFNNVGADIFISVPFSIVLTYLFNLKFFSND